MRRVRHLGRQLHTALPCRGVVAAEGVRPEEEGTQAADGNTDIVGRLTDRVEILRSSFGREVVVQVVVQLDAVETSVLGELQTLAQRHPRGVGKRPQVDRLLHVIAPGRGAARVGLRVWGGPFSGDGRRGTGGEGRAEGSAASDGARRLGRWVVRHDWLLVRHGSGAAILSYRRAGCKREGATYCTLLASLTCSSTTARNSPRAGCRITTSSPSTTIGCA